MQTIRLFSFTIALLAFTLGSLLYARTADEHVSPYNESLRPQFHFTYKVGWLSDINGPFYYKGEYHLFTQHCPGGPGLNYLQMHWGHVVGKDLLHWEELPPALAPDERGPAGSGSCVVDPDNKSGLKTGKEDVILAFYTACTYIIKDDKPGTICIAYSNDCGRTWTKYKGNPVVKPITHLNRDPKVFWHEPSKKWIMVMTLSCGSWKVDNRFMTLWSTDLKKWHELQRFDMPTAGDCPDMFELAVDGDTDNKRWVIWGGDTTYMIGSFDGKQFIREGEIHTPPVGWMNQGSGGYAAQTFCNMPKSDPRCIQMSWMQQRSHIPGMPFDQQASFPCELTLRKVSDGIRLCRYPIREIEKLHGKGYNSGAKTLRSGQTLDSGLQSDTFDIDVRFKPGEAKRVGLQVRGVDIVYDVAAQMVCCGGASSKLSPRDGCVELRVLVDRCSIEIYGNGGRLVMHYCFPLDAAKKTVRLTCDGGPLEIQQMSVHEVRSIWPSNNSKYSRCIIPRDKA